MRSTDVPRSRDFPGRRMRVAVSTIAIAVATTAIFGTTATADYSHDEGADPSTVAAAATSRWADSHGVYRTLETVETEVYDGPTGEVVMTYTDEVRPTDNVARISQDGNSVEISGSFETVAEDTLAAYASAGSAWNQTSSACQSREQNNTGWIDGCYRIYQLSNDGDSTRRYFAWEQHSTFKSKSAWWMLRAWGSSSKSSNNTSGAWSWVDWSPRSDKSVGNCTATTIGISYVANLTRTYEQCDK